ncbi:DNA-processing protein DprA [Radiobacillus deserti]|uniref:DNA-protecting protein DprA n=1 Tax=Radiobacillus deserti TaxID=2594883 RepID=A0A516KFI4_9BACI|nr:DNA-processing protein DprA [Radiobacillus deserti]QDP40164.1 DNA-protecting protein DprA [Radiobacillus deserti]
MDNARARLIHVYESKMLSRTKIKNLLHEDPTLSILYQSTSSEIASQLQVTTSKASLLHNYLHHQPIAYHPKPIQVVTILDNTYPMMLRSITDPPLVLYAVGKLALLQRQPVLSVVGTRNPSKTAFSVMKSILQPLVQDKWVLVSGMAKGIYSFAHHIALNSGGGTIAVLGGGFQYIYPKENVPLYEEMIASQLVISEYPPSTRPQRYFFPERNRIISGLGFGTLVIEAKEKSGSLITVDQALEQGREVFAVPGSPLNPQTHGCHSMIQDGAKLVQNTYDLQVEWEKELRKWRRIRSK